jgi:hypothetical protein
MLSAVRTHQVQTGAVRSYLNTTRNQATRDGLFLLALNSVRNHSKPAVSRRTEAVFLAGLRGYSVTDMTRSTRLAILSGTLLVLVAGTALGTQVLRPSNQGPLTASQEEKRDAPPTADELAHATERLAASGIDATAEELGALAADYGLGGAIRLLAWADATGMSVEELRALRDDGAGWGQMARDLDVNPGIGTVMGSGGGHGPEDAPGKQKAHDQGDDQPEDSPAE